MIKKVFVLLFSVYFVLGCASYSKNCSDGVCTINDGGKITYEGDQEKIQKIKDEKSADEKLEADINQMWLKAAKKSADEPIKVGIMMPTTAEPSFKTFIPQYRAMLENYFKGKANIEVVPWDKYAGLLKIVSKSSNSDENDSPANFGQKQGPRAIVPEKEIVESTRFLNAPLDVLVFMDLRPKETTGIIKGSTLKKGAVVTVSNVDFHVTMTPLFQFKPVHWNTVGKSSAGIEGAGYEKGKKTQTGKINFNRNIKLDEPAISTLANSALAKLNQRHTKLPSEAASKTIRQEQRKIASEKSGGLSDVLGEDGKVDKDKAIDKLKGFFKKE